MMTRDPHASSPSTSPNDVFDTMLGTLVIAFSCLILLVTIIPCCYYCLIISQDRTASACVMSHSCVSQGASGPGTVTNNLRVLLSGTGAVANLTDKVGVSDSGATFSDDGNVRAFHSLHGGGSPLDSLRW